MNDSSLFFTFRFQCFHCFLFLSAGVCVCGCVLVGVCAWMCVHACACALVCAHVCVCLCVCVCVY